MGTSSAPGADRRRPAVVLFAKAPRPGAVKTRLCPPLTPEEAAGLYSGFLRQLLRPVPGVATFCYGWPADGLDELAALGQPGLEYRPQRGADLWARMTACFAELFEAGFGPVVLRNTDSPDLPPARIAEALARCAPGRVVLGPDPGGGYYLVALSAPAPELFQGLDEGAATVMGATVARARALGLEVAALEVEPDVDTYADLLALWRRRET